MKTLSGKSKCTVAVDIDGIITNETEGHDYHCRTPNKENIAKLNAAYNNGHKIILFTARYQIDASVTFKWLHDHGVHFHEVIFGKPQYDFLIDDKAFNSFEALHAHVYKGD